MHANSNYPPGVTGTEPEIAGVRDDDNPAVGGPDTTGPDPIVMQMPLGMTMLFGTYHAHITGLPYKTQPVEGECDECGVKPIHESVQIETAPDGCCFYVACPNCGTRNILAVYEAKRHNPTPKA